MQPASPTPTFLGNKVKLPTQHDRRSLDQDCNSRRGTFLCIERAATSVGECPRPQGRARRQPFTEDNMMERLLALLLAGALVAPQVGPASESAVENERARPAAAKFSGNIT